MPGTSSVSHRLQQPSVTQRRGNFEQFEEMYEQKRTEVNKAAEKYEKQIKAAKRSGNKANQVPGGVPDHQPNPASTQKRSAHYLQGCWRRLHAQRPALIARF